jgi:hypothetical protein
MGVVQLNERYNMSQVTTKISEIGLRFNDSPELEFVSLEAGVSDPERLQNRVDNLYRSEFQAGLIIELVAYDESGSQLGTLSANKFFGQMVGF